MGSLGVWKARVDLEGTHGWEEIPVCNPTGSVVGPLPRCSFPPHINLLPSPSLSTTPAPQALFQEVLSEMTFMYMVMGLSINRLEEGSPITCCALCGQCMCLPSPSSHPRWRRFPFHRRGTWAQGVAALGPLCPVQSLPRGLGESRPPACVSHSGLREIRNLEPQSGRLQIAASLLGAGPP